MLISSVLRRVPRKCTVRASIRGPDSTSKKEKPCRTGSICSNGILLAFNLLPSHFPYITPQFVNHRQPTPTCSNTFNSSLLPSRPKANVWTAEMPVSLERCCIPESFLPLKSTSVNSPEDYHTQQRDAIQCNVAGWLTWLFNKWERTFVNDFRTWEGGDTEPNSPTYKNSHSSAY